MKELSLVSKCVLLASVSVGILSGRCGAASNPSSICGKPDDGLIHTPPNYSCAQASCAANPFRPPAKGASYVDPQYGCSVTRLTDAVGDNLGAAAHHQYGTITPINANNTYVIVLLENGSQEIVGTSGNVIVPAVNFPGANTANVPWDISIPTRFYYTAGAAIFRGDITGLPGCASTHNCTVASTKLHNFSGTYTSVQIPDQEDISNDGNHLWLVGNTSAFLYTISSNTVGKAMNVGTKDSANGWHKIQIMPSNRMLMTWSPNGRGPGAGQEVYNTDTTLNWHMFDNTIHTDCGQDLSGNEVCVVDRIPDTGGGITGAGACPTWTGSQDGGTDVINMSTHGAQCLVDINWVDAEVSFRDGNANGGWVFITFFKSQNCNTYSCFDTTSPSRLDPSWATDWVHFAEEGILVRIDNNNGPNLRRLFHTRSRSSEYYWAEPRGSISRDGQYVVFDSNFDISSTGLTNYSDVYLSHVAAPSAQLSAAPGTLAFGSVLVGNTSALSGNLTASSGNVTVNSATVAGSGYSLSGLTLPLTLVAGQSATFTVDFTPTATGSSSGSISFSDSASTSPTTVSLSGNGVTPLLTASSSSLAFGNVLVGNPGSLSGSLTASVGSVTISSATVTGSGYSISGLSLPLTLTAGQSASFNVAFAPTAAGSSNGSVSFSSSAANSPTTVSLSGTGITPLLNSGSSSLAFGNVLVGNTGALSGTLTASQGGVTISSENVTGSGFSISGLSLPLTLAAGQSTSFTVAFAPSTTGSASGSVSFSSSASNSPTTISVSGTGVTPLLNSGSSSLAFGNVAVGSTGSLSETLTASQGSVTISSANVTGSGFSISGLSLPLTLAAGQSVSFTADFAPTAAASTTGSISFSSSASNSPTTVSLSGSGIVSTAGTICGKPDDGMVHLPPSYSCTSALCSVNPFPPPAKTASFTDPAYGCSVTRLTDVVGDSIGLAAHHQYGTITPINANDTYVMILLEDGNQEIIDTSGNVIVPVANLPGTNTNDVPWDISIATRFYYAANATLFRGDITGLPGCASTHNCTVASTTLHDFTGVYSTVLIPDQEDLSDDGDHLWLVGDTSAFLYTISTNIIGKTMNVGTKDSATGWHKIQIMPSNRMLMTWSPNGTGPGAGQEVYNTDTTLNWHMFDNTLHTDCGRDLSGNEVCVAARIPDTGGGITGACPTWDGHQDGGIDVINMTTHGAQCLVDVNFADTEISFRDGNANGGWVFITFFNSGSCPTYSCFDTLSPTHLDLSWATNWVHFAEEGLLVRIDNNNSTANKFRLFHTRSRSSEYYWSIPRGAISRDGRYVVFDSNFDISNTGLTDYTDVYISKTH